MRKTFSQHAQVGDIRGRGLFWSVEFVADRTTKAPFPASDGIATKVGTTAKAMGMMIYPSQGCADGTNGDHVLLAPSYTSTRTEIDLIVETLSTAVAEVLGG